jgi:hypothetical protein
MSFNDLEPNGERDDGIREVPPSGARAILRPSSRDWLQATLEALSPRPQLRVSRGDLNHHLAGIRPADHELSKSRESRRPRKERST